MNSAKELIEEHAVIMKVLAALKKQAGTLAIGKLLPGTPLKETLDLLTDFADKCHHGKEEKVLFPALAKNPKYKAAVAEFLEEHARGRVNVRAMRDTLYGVSAGNDATIRRFTENANAYFGMLVKHIQKENALFAKVGEIFSDKENARMAKEYERIEKEMGEGKHGEYAERAERHYAEAMKL